MAQINCAYGSVRLPVKDLLEEILDKTERGSNIGVDKSWDQGVIELDTIEQFRKLVLEQVKACTKHVKEDSGGGKMRSFFAYVSDNNYRFRNAIEGGFQLSQHFECVQNKNHFTIILVHSLASSEWQMVRITYDLILRNLTVKIQIEDSDCGSHDVEKVLKNMISVYDPRGEGYRVVTPSLADEFEKIEKPQARSHQDRWLTSKLIPESFQPPPLSLLSAKKLSDKIRQEYSDEVDMAYYQNKRPRLMQTTSDGYLFTQIQ